MTVDITIDAVSNRRHPLTRALLDPSSRWNERWLEWLRSIGVTPETTRSVRVTDTTVTIQEYALDERGSPYVVDREVAMRAPVTAAVSPPGWLWEIVDKAKTPRALAPRGLPVSKPGDLRGLPTRYPDREPDHVTLRNELARQLRATMGRAELLEANLDRLLDQLTDGLDGQRAARYDGSVIHGTTIADPVGNTVAEPNEASRDLTVLTGAISAALSALDQADQVRRQWVGPVDGTTLQPIAHAPAAVDNVERWCRSCARDDGYCEPISPKHRTAGLCRWCAEFHAAHGVEPPISLLVKRHRGQRIYDLDVKRAMAEVRATKRKRRPPRTMKG